METTAKRSSAPTSSCIRNFRSVGGVSRIYRCANTDGLGSKSNAPQQLAGSEYFVFCKAGLILDLRAPFERDEENAQLWMSRAPPNGVLVLDGDVEDFEYIRAMLSYNVLANRQRVVIRINTFRRSRMKNYMERNWLTKDQVHALRTANTNERVREIKMLALYDKGLAGFNELMLETGKEQWNKVLRIITIYLQANRDDDIVFHCVQGKDRTGVLSMLLQALLGESDDEIVSEYAKSEQHLTRWEGSAALGFNYRDENSRLFQIRQQLYSGAPPEAMIGALAYLRSKYGSVVPGYFDSIGFDESWRFRLVTLLSPPTSNL